MTLSPSSKQNFDIASKPPRRKIRLRNLILIIVAVSLLVFIFVPLVPISQYCYSGWVTIYQYLLIIIFVHGTPTSINFGIPYGTYGIC